MLELITQFKPADGSPPHAVTLRIGDLRETDGHWSAQVEILGFRSPESVRVHGVDWAQAIELAAKYIPVVLEGMVHGAGGGTLDPPIYPRDAEDAEDDAAEQTE